MGQRQMKASAAGHAARRARSNAKYDTIVAVSKQGGTLADAAAASGLTTHGVKSILKRKHGGSVRWPIAEEWL